MFTLLQAQAGGGWATILMLVAMFAIFYFFMIRPQQVRQKEIEKARQALTIGSKVVTSSGVHATIKSLNEGESYFTLEVAKGVCIRVERSCVFADANQMADSGATASPAEIKK